MKQASQLFLILLLGSGMLLQAAAPGPRFNVRDYGAVGDGVQKDTVAIARAIEACVQAGGGVVEFPAGRYLTGTINLKSNITLHVGPGATLLGSPDIADYPIVPNPWGVEDWQGPTQMSALIYADGVENIGITGPGTIDGQGLIWWKRRWILDQGKKGFPKVDDVPLADGQIVAEHGGRPRMIRLVNSRHVRVENITLINSPRWTLNPLFCDYVTITGVTIINPANAPNTDGINPESCRNVHISNCHIDTGDDGITLKSGHNAVGRAKARPTENVTITNCTFRNAHGGIVIGSDMSGDVRNVTASNCVFQGTEKGIRIKSNRERGGVVERITFTNLAMQNVVEPINIVTFYFSADTPGQVFPVGEGTPRFRDIHINDVTAGGSARAGQITGLKEMPVSEITLSNIRINARSGFRLENAKGIRFNRVQVDTKSGPSIRGTNIVDIEIEGFRNAAPHSDAPLIDMSDVKGIWIRNARAPEGTATFLRVRGAGSSNVSIADSELRYAREVVTFAEDADKRILLER